MSEALLVAASFLASAVEMVEAVTIVLAVGITRGWRAALVGAAGGLLVLALVLVALGPSLVTYVPIGALRVVVGTLLLIFGLQWLRKAVLRAAGLKEKHDEERIFQAEASSLVGMPGSGEVMDWPGFVVSFKGVFLEGLEVGFIVLTFGANSGRFDLSAFGALGAFVLIGAIAILVHRPLSRVPENGIKYAVGSILMAFGTFWGGEGVGIEWAFGDLSIVVFAVFYGLGAAPLIRWLGSRNEVHAEAAPAVSTP